MADTAAHLVDRVLPEVPIRQWVLTLPYPPRHSRQEPSPHPEPRGKTRRMRWAVLLQRVFEVDALQCPRCGATLRLIAAIEDPTVARRILECLKLPARAPPLEPAAADAPDVELGLDEDSWFFDQSPAHDETDPLVSGS